MTNVKKHLITALLIAGVLPSTKTFTMSREEQSGRNYPEAFNSYPEAYQYKNFTQRFIHDYCFYEQQLLKQAHDKALYPHQNSISTGIIDTAIEEAHTAPDHDQHAITPSDSGEYADMLLSSHNPYPYQDEILAFEKEYHIRQQAEAQRAANIPQLAYVVDNNRPSSTDSYHISIVHAYNALKSAQDNYVAINGQDPYPHYFAHTLNAIKCTNEDYLNNKETHQTHLARAFHLINQMLNATHSPISPDCRHFLCAAQNHVLDAYEGVAQASI